VPEQNPRFRVKRVVDDNAEEALLVASTNLDCIATLLLCFYALSLFLDLKLFGTP